MPANVLSNRDTNAQMKSASPQKKAEKPEAKSLDAHRQELASRLKENDKTQQYVSPSDSIQSPATQKLSAFRNKQITKKSKPQTLFKSTSSKKIESAKGTAMFADIPKTDQGANDGEVNAKPYQQSLKDEIADLERRLQDAKSRLILEDEPADSSQSTSDAALHALLLLADSALPLGSFAFSSGLESYLAHHKPSPPSASQLPSFHVFLRLSLSTLASTALPYVLAGYRSPADIETLDNDFDASTPCTVARRASIAQGRALLAVWERSYRTQYSPTATNVADDDSSPTRGSAAAEALTSFSAALRKSDLINAHLAPLWGLVTCVLDVPLRDAAYLFLFSHARTVVSAAVRASVMGPYQAQAELASTELQDRIRGLVEEGWERKVEDAGQSVPVMDLWVGRHEKLYSRIFNS
ncbi:hypothetical protein P171DRAFT_483434 [Karstenula rhodostoma CBS 690.94]|uniref:Urease accessory protein UreF n=1 Tax=Karstenula rhodostoma CBS 690.94 TaxID=1392251 RepID=A0A9P4PJ59_9PLEO|nr:hypothetical protein P171DRAFT_483434 [Karstenula rhodostoma CBS 690.94]